MIRSKLSSSCAALVLALLAVGPALAEDAPAAPARPARAKMACRPDVKRFCGDVQPGGGRIVACLKDHSADLSPDCTTALAVMEARRANAAPK